MRKIQKQTIWLFAISFLGILSGFDLGGQDAKEIAGSKGIISDQGLFFIPFTDGRKGAPENTFYSRPKEFTVLEGKHIYPQELGGVDYLENEIPQRYLLDQFSLTDSIVLVKKDSSQKILFINPEIDDSLNFKNQSQIHIWNIDNWTTDEEGHIFYRSLQDDFDQFGIDI